jgi:DegV family protein with EDD domain
MEGLIISIKIVTDSTSYIPKDLLDTYDISVVSLGVSFPDGSHRELDLNNDTFYDKMAQSKTIPTSSQPSVKEMTDVFEGIVAKGDQAVAVFLSSKMSGTYSSAFLAKDLVKEKYPEGIIEILDSTSNCMQLGFPALAAARAAKDGAQLSEVISRANDVIQNSRFLFVPDSLEYLRKGGRIGGAAAIIGGILHIKPILTVEQGKTAVFDKVRTKKKAIDTMISFFKAQIDEKGLGDVAVHHIHCEEDGKRLAEKIAEITGHMPRVISIGPVIGLHVGPGTMGIAYYTRP